MLGGRSDDDFMEQPGAETVKGGRGRRRRQREERVIDEAVRKRFTPDEVDCERCLARVRNHGYGGQCFSKRRAGSEFCGQHQKSQPCGLVTGPIPATKVNEFLRSEARRIRRGGDARLGEGPRRVDEKPRQGRRLHWYTRFHMWHTAKRVRARGDRRAKRGALRRVEDL